MVLLMPILGKSISTCATALDINIRNTVIGAESQHAAIIQAAARRARRAGPVFSAAQLHSPSSVVFIASMMKGAVLPAAMLLLVASSISHALADQVPLYGAL